MCVFVLHIVCKTVVGTAISVRMANVADSNAMDVKVVMARDAIMIAVAMIDMAITIGAAMTDGRNESSTINRLDQLLVSVTNVPYGYSMLSIMEFA